ncbi:MAG: HAMP domain-containing protein, partial [Betaproteobacteria bacterium]|nr:HAMP domain-containing protein [Betaproteobacteria bacterium]
MNLKLRLNLIITTLLLLVMLIGALLMIRSARDDVRAEVESTALLALHLLDAEILHYTSDYTWLNGVNPNKAPIFRLKSLESVRHLRIDFFDAQGNLRDSNRSASKVDERSAPVWFIKALDVIYEKMPPVKRQIFANGRVLGELVMTPDPSYEVAEIWSDMLGLLALATIFFIVVNAMIYWAVGRALRPVNRVLFALSELEQGNLDSRLPSFPLPELSDISRKFNAMAEALQSSIKSNHLLTQQMMSLQEDERKSLARDLHDEVGQHLTAIHVDASTILHAKTIADARESAKAIEFVARQMMGIVRGILQRLRPGSLDELGLKAALQDLIDAWLQRNSSVTVDVSISGDF